MKNKLFLIIAIVCVLITGKFLINKFWEPREVSTPTTSTFPTSGEFCFTRTQKATESAPYNIEEHVKLNFNDKSVTGSKTGTQAGPDMTNGYEGTLTGAVVEDEMEL